MDLKDIRKDIDAIDTQICDLFKKRMDVLFCCAGMFCDWLRKSVQLGKICKTWLRRDRYDRNT